MEEAGPDCLWLSYIYAPGTTILDIWIRPTSSTDYIVLSAAQRAQVAGEGGLIKFESGQMLGDPNPATFTMVADSNYEVYFDLTLPDASNPTLLVTFRTGAADSLPCDYVPSKKRGAKIPTPTPTPRPAVNSCPTLLPDILVIGYASFHSQCRAVDAAAVGRADLVQRGVIAAVDIWYHVPPSGIGVCFRNSGAAVVFLDAAYSPRRLSTLNHLALPNGMTCALIRSAGTVVLLAS